MRKYMTNKELQEANEVRMTPKSIVLTQKWTDVKNGKAVRRRSSTYFKMNIENHAKVLSRKWY